MRLSTRLFRSSAQLLLVLGASAAGAAPEPEQSPETAVAYLVAGMTDGATIGTSVFKRTGTSPAVFSTQRTKPSEHEPQVTIEVTRKGGCVFDLALTMDQGHGASKRVDTLDFSKVRAMEYVGHEHVKVTGTDYCKGDIAPACHGVLATDVLPANFSRAYADLRHACP